MRTPVEVIDPAPPRRVERRGRKPAGYVRPDELLDLDAAKARKEAALADTYELEYKIKCGEYVSRASVKQASATVLAAIAQTLRSIGDNLERRGVSAEICATVDAVIAETLADAGRELEHLAHNKLAEL